MVLANSDISVEEMTAWMKELFLGKGTEKFKVPEDILEFGFGLMVDNFAKARDGNIRRMILRKILHTREVVVAGLEIVEKEKSVDWDPFMVGAVTFAHDFGRFPQAQLGSYSDAKTGFDHAVEGANLIEKGLSSKAAGLGIEMKRLVEAVRHHSALEYKGKDLYAKFIRDADKIGLMNYFHYHMDDYNFPKGRITEGALERFLAGEMVYKRDILTRSDVALCWLSWVHDFNLEETRKIFDLEEVKDSMLAEIEKNDKEAFDLISRKLD